MACAKDEIQCSVCGNCHTPPECVPWRDYPSEVLIVHDDQLVPDIDELQGIISVAPIIAAVLVDWSALRELDRVNEEERRWTR